MTDTTTTTTAAGLDRLFPNAAGDCRVRLRAFDGAGRAVDKLVPFADADATMAKRRNSRWETTPSTLPPLTRRELAASDRRPPPNQLHFVALPIKTDDAVAAARACPVSPTLMLRARLAAGEETVGVSYTVPVVRPGFQTVSMGGVARVWAVWVLDEPWALADDQARLGVHNRLGALGEALDGHLMHAGHRVRDDFFRTQLRGGPWRLTEPVPIPGTHGTEPVDVTGKPVPYARLVELARPGRVA